MEQETTDSCPSNWLPSANWLPIIGRRHEILETVRKNAVVILCGPDDSEKTTMVPQLLLEDYRQRGLYCNIVVVQPSIYAACSNAKRVCRDRDWAYGDLVGYQVRLQSKTFRTYIHTYTSNKNTQIKNQVGCGGEYKCCSDNTCILFCTADVFLEHLACSGGHNLQYTHIILDGVLHGRDTDMDFVMNAMQKYLGPENRLLLMPAVANVDKVHIIELLLIVFNCNCGIYLLHSFSNLY